MHSGKMYSVISNHEFVDILANLIPILFTTEKLYEMHGDLLGYKKDDIKTCMIQNVLNHLSNGTKLMLFVLLCSFDVANKRLFVMLHWASLFDRRNDLVSKMLSYAKRDSLASKTNQTNRPWAHLVCDLFERHIDTMLAKKFPSKKIARYQENGWFVIIYY